MRRLITSESNYHVHTGRYSQSLSELDRDLAQRKAPNGCLRGYCYRLRVTVGGYEIEAWPERPESGYRSFYANESGVLRYSVGSQMATVKDAPLH